MTSAGKYNGLYRTEVFENLNQRRNGVPFISTPVTFKVITTLLFCIVAVAVLLLIFGSYTRNSNVSGYLVPDRGIISLENTTGGVIEKLNVSVGDYVEKGTELVTLSSDRHGYDGLRVGQKNLQSLEQQLDQLTNRRAILRKKHAIDQARIKSSLASTRLELIAAKREQSARETQIEIDREQLTRLENLLSSNFTSRSEVLSARRRVSTGEREILQLSSRIAGLEAGISSHDIDRLSATTDFEDSMSQLNIQISELRSRIAIEKSGFGETIIAPVSGTIASLSGRSTGQSIEAGTTLLSISPSGSKLQARLVIPSRAVGFLKDGQKVSLQYDAYPYQRYGVFEAVLLEVSEASIVPEIGDRLYSASESVFIGIADLDLKGSQEFYDYRDIKLKPGMSFNAIIELDNYTFLEWLLRPVKSVSERSS